MKELMTLKISYRTLGGRAAFFILQSTLTFSKIVGVLLKLRFPNGTWDFIRIFFSMTVYAAEKPLNILEYLLGISNFAALVFRHLLIPKQCIPITRHHHTLSDIILI